MNKPSWFQPLDLFPLLLPVLAAAFAFIVGFEADHHTQAGIMLVAVPVLMWTIWGFALWRRKKFLDSCIWYPNYRIMLQPENWLPPAESEFDNFIQSVARSWTPFHPGAERLLKSRTKWVYMKKGLDEKPIKPSWGLVKGITVAGGSVIYVDYNEKLDTIEHTAFAHELGHVIMGLATGEWDQATHHAFTKKNHLR
jgi:hypothetical protein